MAIWYYYNKNGGKTGPFTVAALKELVRQGVVTRETVIENTNGRTIIAGEVNGLTFPEAPPIQPKPATKPVKPATVPVPPVHPATPVLPRVPVRSKQSKNRPKPVIIAGIAGAALLLLLLVAGVWWMRGPSTATVGPMAPVGQEQKPVESVPVIEKSEFTQIYHALREGTVADVRYLLEKEGVDVNVHNRNPSNLLHRAFSDSRHDAVLDIVKYLIEKGAGVNAIDQSNNARMEATPLHNAILYKQNLAVIKFLVESGADLNAKNTVKLTPLYYALEQRDCDMEVVKFLVSKEADINAVLHHAIGKGMDLEFIKFLVASGADVNAKNEKLYGQTPLHIIVGRNFDYPNFIEPINFLVASGADINARNNRDETPLWIAINLGKDVEVIKFLVSKGADANAKNADGFTPFGLAKAIHQRQRQKNSEEVVEYLSGLQ